MEFNYAKSFKKTYKKLSFTIQKKVEERLAIFIKDEFNPILGNHKLHGEYIDCRSINITADIRIIYQKRSNDYLLKEIGTHAELYE